MSDQYNIQSTVWEDDPQQQMEECKSEIKHVSPQAANVFYHSLSMELLWFPMICEKLKAEQHFESRWNILFFCSSVIVFLDEVYFTEHF